MHEVLRVYQSQPDPPDASSGRTTNCLGYRTAVRFPRKTVYAFEGGLRSSIAFITNCILSSHSVPRTCALANTHPNVYVSPRRGSMKSLSKTFVELYRQMGGTVFKARCIKLYIYGKEEFAVELRPYTDRGQCDTFDTCEPPPERKSEDDYSPVRAQYEPSCLGGLESESLRLLETVAWVGRGRVHSKFTSGTRSDQVTSTTASGVSNVLSLILPSCLQSPRAVQRTIGRTPVSTLSKLSRPAVLCTVWQDSLCDTRTSSFPAFLSHSKTVGGASDF